MKSWMISPIDRIRGICHDDVSHCGTVSSLPVQGQSENNESIRGKILAGYIM